MKHIKIFGLVFMAVFALSATAVAPASAAEPTKILPEPTANEPLSFNDKSGAGTLETKNHKVTCTADTSTGSATSPNLGTFEVKFTGCKSSGGPCTGEGEPNETIATSGVFHYWLALLSEKLVAALVLLVNEVHFTCKIVINVLIVVKGCIAGLAEPTEKLTATTKDVFKQIAAGEPDILNVLPQESTKELNCLLLTSVAGAAAEASGEETTDTNETFKKGGKTVEVLLMNK